MKKSGAQLFNQGRTAGARLTMQIGFTQMETGMKRL
jgi:hypothetical protein